MNDSDKMTLTELLSPLATQAEKDMMQWRVEPGTSAELSEGIVYCTTGGKRLRPALAMLSAQAVGGSADSEIVRRCGIAVEIVHCYSLVHDDLPAMDDDSLRRGRPTAHVQFGEAFAILIGDALLTRAFGVICETNDPSSGRLAAELASAAGAIGMVGGQVADMDLCQIPDGEDALNYIHLRKTAALLRCAARLGAIAAGGDDAQVQAISEYAENLGLAFQIFDDLLDITSSAEQLGKTPGKDAASGKRTHATEIGLDAAHTLGETLSNRSVESLSSLGEKGRQLQELALLLTQRRH